MKTFKFLFIITLLISMTANAQLDKKMWLVGGSGSFNSYKQDYTLTVQNTSEFIHIRRTINEFEIDPKVGYFIIDNLVLGIVTSIITEKDNSTTISGNVGGGSSRSIRFSAGPFVRYYLLDKDKPINIITEINYQLGFLNLNELPKEKGSINKFTFLIGPEIFFNSTAGVEILLGYKSYEEKMNSSIVPSIKNKGFYLAIGFQIHLEKK